MAIERLEKEIKESRQKVALEFLNLDSTDTGALKAFALKYAEQDPELHINTDVKYFMNGDIENLRQLQREFRDDVLNVILIQPQYKDTKPLEKIAGTLMEYTKDRILEWEFDLEGEDDPYLFLVKKLPDANEFPVLLYNWLTHDIIEERRTIKVCAAVDCDNFFVPAPQGSEQKYCSARCRNRIAQRRIRKS
jgi:hypothetical protein